jgi:hypothetical protein
MSGVDFQDFALNMRFTLFVTTWQAVLHIVSNIHKVLYVLFVPALVIGITYNAGLSFAGLSFALLFFYFLLGSQTLHASLLAGHPRQICRNITSF